MLLLPSVTLTTHPSSSFFQKKSFLVSFLCILGITLFSSGFLLGERTQGNISSTNALVQAPSPQAQITVNKTFSFPVINTQGQKVATISYTITDVAKQNQIIIKGQRAQAVDGRTFCIISLTLTNNSQQIIQINTRDYIRLSVEKNTDLLAADIHNDPVIIQPTSTIYTRIGFPVDVGVKHIVLHVGQIGESKTDIPITFSH